MRSDKTGTPLGQTLRAMAPLAATLCAAALALLTPGCRAERTLAVTSQPDGARVLLDDKIIGATPKRHEFHHYGVRRVCVSKDGYRTTTELVELSPPWYGRFPIDIVSEVLLPMGWKDRRHVKIELPEGQEEFSMPGIQSVIERARVLRNAGPEGPGELPPVQTRILPKMPQDPLGPIEGDPLEAQEESARR